MRRLLSALVLLTSLAACDSFGGDDPFDSPYASVFALEAVDADGETVLDGRISLVYNPSDVSSIPSAYGGRWDLDAMGDLQAQPDAPDGRGALRGDAEGAIEIQLFRDDGYEEPLAFYLVFETTTPAQPRSFSGRWELRGGFTGGALFSGPFDADLLREATRFHVAG